VAEEVEADASVAGVFGSVSLQAIAVKPLRLNRYNNAGIRSGALDRKLQEQRELIGVATGELKLRCTIDGPAEELDHGSLKRVRMKTLKSATPSPPASGMNQENTANSPWLAESLRCARDSMSESVIVPGVDSKIDAAPPPML